MPRHARGTTSNTSRTAARAGPFPPSATERAYWFSTCARPSSSCRTHMCTPWRRSSGSKPVTTIGTRQRMHSGWYSSSPITVQTCPAARKPSTRRPGAARIASIAGGTVTCETSSEKFRSPRRRAARTAMAFAGAVVSKPTAKKTTSRSGRRAASATASIGEYTIRTSPPALLTARRSLAEPGTRSMSPNEQKVTSGRAAIASARSIASSGVTHTGQPGPCTSETSGGKSSSMPKRTIAWVCPPQTSITVHRRVTSARIAAA